MATTAGAVYLPVRPELSQFAPGVFAGLDLLAGPLGAKSRELGSTIGLGLTAAFVGFGALALKSALEVDSAYDKIRAGTGLTGGALRGLEADFRKVGATVPTDLGRVADVLTQVYQRTGLTGPALQDLSRQIIQLGELGQDVSVDQITRLLGDWSIPADQAAAALDRVFRASQLTGVEMSTLADRAVRFGGPMRQLGFSLDETVAIIGKFQKEGVTMELVMGSMRMALGRMAREGEEPIETLRRVMEQIKTAGDAGKANAIALELFGVRAGPDMAAAIREGRFEIDSLVDRMRNGTDTIGKATKATEDFPQQFAKFRNELTLALAPLGQELFPALSSAAMALIPVVQAVARAFNSLGPGGRQVVIVLGGIVAAVTPVTMIGTRLVSTFKTVSAAFSVMSKLFMTNPWVLLIAAVIVLVVVIVKNWDTIKAFLIRTWNQIVDGARKIWNTLVDFFKRFWPILIVAITGPLGLLVVLIVKNWNTIVDFARTAWNTILDVVRTVWNAIVAYIQFQVNLASTIIRNVVGGIQQTWNFLWNAMTGPPRLIGDIISTVVDFIIAKLTMLANWIRENASKILGPLGGIVDAVGGIGGRALDLVGLAEGGPVRKGQFYIVGEKGPELFRASADGDILPNHRLAQAAMTPSVNVSTVVAGAGGGGFSGPVVHVGQMVVRDESDIDRVSRSLNAHITRTLARKGQRRT